MTKDGLITMTKFTQIGSFNFEIDRVKDLPSASGRFEMESAFGLLAAKTALKTHRDTHALVLSMRTKFGGSGSKWTGQMKFGGGKVNYAIYEFNGIHPGRKQIRKGVGRSGMGRNTVPWRKGHNYGAKLRDHNPMPNGKPEPDFIGIILRELSG